MLINIELRYLNALIAVTQSRVNWLKSSKTLLSLANECLINYIIFSSLILTT